MSVHGSEEQEVSRRCILTGETPEETLHNIGCVLQVLSDAAIAEGESPELTRGWWLMLQTLSDTALHS
jgi:hypothetical protein